MTQPTSGPQSAVDLIAAQREEYETYIAVTEINIGTARAFNTGDPVPASTVDRLNLLDLGLVAKRDSDDAVAILEQAHPVDPDEFLRDSVLSQATMPQDGMRMPAPSVTAVPESTSDTDVPKAETTTAKSGTKGGSR